MEEAIKSFPTARELLDDNKLLLSMQFSVLVPMNKVTELIDKKLYRFEKMVIENMRRKFYVHNYGLYSYNHGKEIGYFIEDTILVEYLLLKKIDLVNPDNDYILEGIKAAAH